MVSGMRRIHLCTLNKKFPLEIPWKLLGSLGNLRRPEGTTANTLCNNNDKMDNSPHANKINNIDVIFLIAVF